MTTTNEMRDRMVSLVDNAKATVMSTRQAATVAKELRKLPGVEMLDPTHMRDHEFEFRFSMLENLEEEVATLRSLAPLQLSVVPEVVDLLPISETESDAVLILRYAACPGERLLRVEETDQPFRPEAAARLRSDVQKLVAAGWVHPYAAEDLFYWLVSSETGTIVFDAWWAAAPATTASSEHMLTSVDAWLASRAA